MNAVQKHSSEQEPVNGSPMMISEKRWIREGDEIWPQLPPESHSSAQVHHCRTISACSEQVGNANSRKTRRRPKSGLCSTGHKLFNYCLLVNFFSWTKLNLPEYFSTTLTVTAVVSRVTLLWLWMSFCNGWICLFCLFVCTCRARRTKSSRLTVCQRMSDNCLCPPSWCLCH